MRALSFTGILCSSAMGSTVSTGWPDREVKQKFTPLGSLSDKGPKFLTITSGKCQEELTHGKACCHHHMQALHRNQPLHLHFPRSTNRSGRQRRSFPDEQHFWCCDSASKQETVESHSYPAVPPRACKTNAIVPLPSPIRFRHVIQVQPPGPFWPGGGREQTQNPTSTRELISLF